MARPLRIEYPGAFYHITARGNEQKAIYKSLRDREKFLGYLESAHKRYGAVIHVYCLMTNHYHLLLETPRGNLSQRKNTAGRVIAPMREWRRNQDGWLWILFSAILAVRHRLPEVNTGSL